MPTLAGWLTGEQVPHEIIEQTLRTMETVLEAHGGRPARTVQPGAGLVAFADTAYAMRHNDEPPVLDWVPDRRTLVYRRPLSGMHPLYYVADWPAQGNLLFASEIKALLALGMPRRLCLPALDALLDYGFIPAPLTAFKDIYVVPAGSILRWQRAKVVVNTSTDYALDEPLFLTDAPDQLHTLLKSATEGLLPPHEQLVVLTGGGIASTLATTLAVQATEHTSTATTTSPFTIAFLGYKKTRTTRQQRAVEQLAAHWQHPSLAISSLDAPEFWMGVLAGLEAPCVDTLPLALHQLLHTVAAETGARVAITGLGARFLLGNEAQQSLHTSATPASEQVYSWYQQAFHLHEDPPASLWSEDVQQILRTEEPWEQGHHARKLAHKVSRMTEAERVAYYLDLHLRLPDMLVGAAQQLAAQEHMVLRSPYLHHDVIDLLTRLPATLEDGTPKRDMLRHIMQQCYSTIPVVQSPLPLTVPLQSLLQSKDNEIVQQTLSSEVVQKTGIFDAEVVESLLQRKEVTRELLLVFTTQLFCRLFEASM
jgi:asparagine synthetase B (glutamine-hydrolysing)